MEYPSEKSSELERYKRLLEREREWRRRAEVKESSLRAALAAEQKMVSFLQSIKRAASKSNSPTEYYQAMLQEIGSWTNMLFGHVFLTSEENREILISSDIWWQAEGQNAKAFIEASKGYNVSIGSGLPGMAAEAGHLIFISNINAQHFQRFNAALEAGVLCATAFPIFINGTLKAVLEFFSNREPKSDEISVKMLSEISPALGEELERLESRERNKKITRVLESRVRHLEVLRDIDHAIASGVNKNNIITLLVRHVQKSLGATGARILQFDHDFESITCIAQVAQQGCTLPVPSSHYYNDPLFILARTGSIVALDDLAGIEDQSGWRASIEKNGIRTYFAAPLTAMTKVEGILEVWSHEPIEIDEEWRDHFQSISSQCALAIYACEMVAELKRSNTEMRVAYDATIVGWSKALEFRDKETDGHSQRVVELSVQLAQKLGVRDEDIVHIRRGALLHDIGKMGIPDSILLKKGSLTPEEWEIMKKHPAYAFEMLFPINFLRPSLVIPRLHHEKWDGTGYPNGLKGVEIPIAARIFAVVDVFDALTNDRPYRKAWSLQETMAHMLSLSGTHFDPHVVEAFLSIINQDAIESSDSHPLPKAA
jgi:HD-GYP domain-containing protein (c-di-GMP phosphodiesterase class II)